MLLCRPLGSGLGLFSDPLHLVLGFFRKATGLLECLIASWAKHLLLPLRLGKHQPHGDPECNRSSGNRQGVLLEEALELPLRLLGLLLRLVGNRAGLALDLVGEVAGLLLDFARGLAQLTLHLVRSVGELTQLAAGRLAPALHHQPANPDSGEGRRQGVLLDCLDEAGASFLRSFRRTADHLLGLSNGRFSEGVFCLLSEPLRVQLLLQGIHRPTQLGAGLLDLVPNLFRTFFVLRLGGESRYLLRSPRPQTRFITLSV